MQDNQSYKIFDYTFVHGYVGFALNGCTVEEGCNLVREAITALSNADYVRFDEIVSEHGARLYPLRSPRGCKSGGKLRNPRPRRRLSGGVGKGGRG